MKKHYSKFKVMVFMVLALAGTAKAQSTRTLYFSNQFRSDPATMPETSNFALDDPVYVVLNINRPKYTLADFVSVDPSTGKTNFWLCFSPELSDQHDDIKPKCVGILPEPVTDASLTAKATAYKILPAGNELASSKTELSETILEMLRVKQRETGVTIPFTYYIYGKAEGALKAGQVYFPMKDWKSSQTEKFLIDRYQKEQNDYVAKRKVLLTDRVKSLVSKRNDPALEKAIRASDPAPILHIVFLTPAYDIVRNDLGIVLRKTIRTVYVYKWVQTGKCYAHWHAYGYESLGGATFSTDLGSWVVYNDDGTLGELIVPGTDDFPSGQNWEVDCSAFEKPATPAKRPTH